MAALDINHPGGIVARSSVPSVCLTPQCSKYRLLRELPIIKVFCQSNQKFSCPNNNPLCKLLAELEKEKQGLITTVCSCLGYNKPSITISVPPSTTVSLPAITSTSTGCPAAPPASTATTVCPKGNDDCGDIYPGFVQYHYGQFFVTGNDCSCNISPSTSGGPGTPTTYTYDGSLSKCDAANSCVNDANDMWMVTVDLHYEQISNTWVCVAYYGDPTCGDADYHHPDPQAVCVYGFAFTDPID